MAEKAGFLFLFVWEWSLEHDSENCYNSAVGNVCAREVFLNPAGNISEEPFLRCLQGEPVLDTAILF